MNLDDWIETANGNRFSRSAAIKDPGRISISENCTICEKCTLVGDKPMSDSNVPAIVLGKYTFLDKKCCIDPPRAKLSPDSSTFAQVIIGNYTSIGAGSVVRSIQVGNRVSVGAQCRLGELSVINDCCIIEDNTVVPAKSVISPYSRVSGVPGESYFIEPIGASYRKVLEAESRMRHALG